LPASATQTERRLSRCTRTGCPRCTARTRSPSHTDCSQSRTRRDSGLARPRTSAQWQHLSTWW
jgi:hypothetical protein